MVPNPRTDRQTVVADTAAVWLAAGWCAAPGESQPVPGAASVPRNSPKSSVDACTAECVADKACIAFRFETKNKSCARHSVVGHAVEGNCTSGIVAARYACN